MPTLRLADSSEATESAVDRLDNLEAGLESALNRIPKRYRVEEGNSSCNSQLMTQKIGGILGQVRSKKGIIAERWDTDRVGALKEINLLNELVFETLSNFLVGVRKYYEAGRAMKVPKYIDYIFCDVFNCFMGELQPVMYKEVVPMFSGRNGMIVVNDKLGNLKHMYQDARTRLGLPPDETDYEKGLVHVESATDSIPGTVVGSNFECVQPGVVRALESDEFEFLAPGSEEDEVAVSPEGVDEPAREVPVIRVVEDDEHVTQPNVEGNNEHELLGSAVVILHEALALAEIGANRNMQEGWWAHVVRSVERVVPIICEIKNISGAVDSFKNLTRCINFGSVRSLVGVSAQQIVESIRGICTIVNGDVDISRSPFAQVCSWADSRYNISQSWVKVERATQSLRIARRDFATMVAYKPLSREYTDGLQVQLVDGILGEQASASMAFVSSSTDRDEPGAIMLPGVYPDPEVDVSTERPVAGAIWDGAEKSRDLSMAETKMDVSSRRAGVVVLGVVVVSLASVALVTVMKEGGFGDFSSGKPTVEEVASPTYPVADAGDVFGGIPDLGHVTEVPVDDDMKLKTYDTIWSAAVDRAGSDQRVSDVANSMLSSNSDVIDSAISRFGNSAKWYSQVSATLSGYGYEFPESARTFHDLEVLRDTGFLTQSDFDVLKLQMGACGLTQGEIDSITGD